MQERYRPKPEAPAWTSVGYVKNPGDNTDLILIECDGKLHRRAVYHRESGDYTPSGEPYPCDQGEHSQVFNLEKQA